MKHLYLLSFTLILAGGAVSAAIPDPVRLDSGSVSGNPADDAGVRAFKGIPFAAPPIGDLRWRAPQPAAKWEGIKRAAEFGPSCVQAMRNPAPGAGQGPGMSEDCLYLNVWTPAKSVRDRIPVLVWIYGGGFNAGATSERNYSGEKLANKGVVFVSIAYRVGLLG